MVKKRVGWPATALKCCFILFFVAIAAWLSRIEVSFLESRDQTSDALTSRSTQGGAEVSAPQLSIAGQSRGYAVKAQVNEASVMRQGDRCIVLQGVRNPGVEPISDVSLRFHFRDSDGRPVGEEQIVASGATIGAGESRRIAFAMSCPNPVARAQVSIPPRVKDIARMHEILLVGTDGGLSETVPSQAGSYILLVPLPDLTICPAPEPCQLPVEIENGEITAFDFQRSASDPTLLTSDASLLIGHLEKGGRASLRAPSNEGETSVMLSDANLAEVEKSKSILSWLGQLFAG